MFVCLFVCLLIFVDGKDYRGEMHTLTFSQDVTQVCFKVAILDDGINEEDEFFTVLLTTTDQNVTLSPNSINIKIKDDDGIHKTSFLPL